MENVLINKVDLIEDVTLLESDNLINLLVSVKPNMDDCLIIKNKDLIRLYLFKYNNDAGKKVSAIKVAGVGVRSNLKVIPLVLKCINDYSEILDLFTNETSVCFIINKCNDKNIISNIKNIFKEEGFDVC